MDTVTNLNQPNHLVKIVTTCPAILKIILKPLKNIFDNLVLKFVGTSDELTARIMILGFSQDLTKHCNLKLTKYGFDEYYCSEKGLAVGFNIKTLYDCIRLANDSDKVTLTINNINNANEEIGHLNIQISNQNGTDVNYNILLKRPGNMKLPTYSLFDSLFELNFNQFMELLLNDHPSTHNEISSKDFNLLKPMIEFKDLFAFNKYYLMTNKVKIYIKNDSDIKSFIVFDFDESGHLYIADIDQS